MYCLKSLLVGLLMLYCVMSATLESPLPTPGVLALDVGQVLRAQAGSQRRTDVQALARDRPAIDTFRESGILRMSLMQLRCRERLRP